MMSDEKIREEFESAYAEEISQVYEIVTREDVQEARIGDTYSVSILASAWWAWQASREALDMEAASLEISRLKDEVDFLQRANDKLVEDNRSLLADPGDSL